MFKLTAQQMEKEPVDEFYTNLFIHAEIEKQKERLQKNG